MRAVVSAAEKRAFDARRISDVRPGCPSERCRDLCKLDISLPLRFRISRFPPFRDITRPVGRARDEGKRLCRRTLCATNYGV